MYQATPDVSTERPTPRFIRIKGVIARTGISRSYIYQLSSSGDFPKPVSLVPGGCAVGWVEGEIDDWINQRIKDRGQEKDHA